MQERRDVHTELGVGIASWKEYEYFKIWNS